MATQIGQRRIFVLLTSLLPSEIGGKFNPFVLYDGKYQSR